MHIDVNIKNLDDGVCMRLRQQATAEGMSLHQYIRIKLTQIASRLSPTEFLRGSEPMSREEFLAIRRRLREIDGS